MGSCKSMLGLCPGIDYKLKMDFIRGKSFNWMAAGSRDNSESQLAVLRSRDCLVHLGSFGSPK